MSQELELEVFRAGDYGPRGQWDETALDRLAGDYDPGLLEAPVTLDHAQSGPALGWVAGLRRWGDRLLARLKGLNTGLIELLRSGAFKKRSVEIYSRLGETGRPYLKAVSFLGAAAPAVKGLTDPLFAEETPAPAKAAFDTFEWNGGETEPPTPGAQPDGAAVFETLRNDLRQSGRWTPAWEELGVGEFYQALAALDEIEISPDAAVAPAEWFGRFLKSLPPVAPMGEAAPASPMSAFGEVPPGPNVSPDSLELHRRAAALLARRPDLNYAGALLECSRR